MAAIYVDNAIDTSTLNEAAASICAIFESANKNGMEQATVVAALEVMKIGASKPDTTISGCTFHGESDE